MNVFNKLFVSHRVKIGPTVLSSYSNQVGTIFFYPTERNIFIEDYSCVAVYDNGDIIVPLDIGTLLEYTAHRNEFIPYCINIWNKEVLSKGNNQLVLCDRVCSIMNGYIFL